MRQITWNQTWEVCQAGVVVLYSLSQNACLKSEPTVLSFASSWQSYSLTLHKEQCDDNPWRGGWQKSSMMVHCLQCVIKIILSPWTSEGIESGCMRLVMRLLLLCNKKRICCCSLMASPWTSEGKEEWGTPRRGTPAWRLVKRQLLLLLSAAAHYPDLQLQTHESDGMLLLWCLILFHFKSSWACTCMSDCKYKKKWSLSHKNHIAPSQMIFIFKSSCMSDCKIINKHVSDGTLLWCLV